jgi:hypothetical protein
VRAEEIESDAAAALEPFRVRARAAPLELGFGATQATGERVDHLGHASMLGRGCQTAEPARDAAFRDLTPRGATAMIPSRVADA